MAVRFFIDANLGRNLVDGLRAFGYDNVEHISENFADGATDTEWLEYVGKNKLVLITKDKALRRHPSEKLALRRYNVVAFFLGGKEMTIRETALQVQTAWKKMEARAEAQQKKGCAAAFFVRRGGGKIDEIPLP